MSPILYIILYVGQTDSGEWTAWSKCSHECGGGEQTRIRVLDRSNQKHKNYILQKEKCNTQPCTPEGNIQGNKVYIFTVKKYWYTYVHSICTKLIRIITV